MDDPGELRPGVTITVPPGWELHVPLSEEAAKAAREGRTPPAFGLLRAALEARHRAQREEERP